MVLSGGRGDGQVVGPPLPIFLCGSSVLGFPHELHNKNEQALCIAGKHVTRMVFFQDSMRNSSNVSRYTTPVTA